MITCKINEDKSATFTATGSDGIKTLINVYGGRDLQKDILAQAELMREDEFTVNVLQSYRCSGEQHWFKFAGDAGKEFAKPYVDKLEKLTGYRLKSGDSVTVIDSELSHTHYVDLLTLRIDGFEWSACESAGPWNGMDAETYAKKKLSGYMLEEFAEREQVREYIPTSGGLYKRNPKYGTGFKSPAHPAVKRDIWTTLFTWWRENKATPAQLEVLEKNDKLPKYLSIGSHTASRIFITNQDTESFEWFAQLGT